MGYITIASRHPESEEIHWDMLEGGSSRQEDNLSTYHIGDTILLECEVSLAHGVHLPPKKSKGLDIVLQTGAEDKEGKYCVSLECSVIKRIHTVKPDWMMNGCGLRASGHTIVIQAVSDEVEEIIVWMLKEEIIT